MGGIPISRVDPTCYQMAFFFGVASGNLLQFAIENGPVEIVDLPIQKGMIFYSKLLVYQRVQVPFSDSGRSGHLFASPGGLSFHRPAATGEVYHGNGNGKCIIWGIYWYLLVGGFKHVDYFSIYWECHHPNWLMGQLWWMVYSLIYSWLVVSNIFYFP